jgi:hypothetical protein
MEIGVAGVAVRQGMYGYTEYSVQKMQMRVGWVNCAGLCFFLWLVAEGRRKNYLFLFSLSYVWSTRMSRKVDFMVLNCVCWNPDFNRVLWKDPASNRPAGPFFSLPQLSQPYNHPSRGSAVRAVCFLFSSRPSGVGFPQAAG